MWNPINRTTVQTEENKYRVYDKRGPINYKKPDGTFDTVDHTFNDTTSTIGDISLMDKGIMSVGKRKGNNPYKVVGIRPDINQHLGTQQLEFSLVNVELDGESQSFNVETDLEIKLGASNVSQLVKANKDFKDFKVEFDIHNTGLEIQNSKYSNTTTIREDFGFNLQNLGNIEGGNTDKTFDNIFTENRTNPYIDSCIFQITNNYITTGQYSNTEEFGDSDLSNYVIDDNVYPNGGAAYLKDCIVLIAKIHNIEESIEDIFVNQMCNEYGLETIWEEEKNGQYFTKNGKKVASYYTIDNGFYMFINTTEIPDDVKTLFQRKTFNDTSFLDITLSDFNTTITNMFNVDLTIELNTDYYKPINNSFVFKVNNESFSIQPPILFDENYNKLNLGTTHSLKQNDDGSYRYTKYFSLNGYLKNSHNIKYIDADLYADTTGAIETQSYRVNLARSSGRFTTARNASTGNLGTSFSGDNGLDITGTQSTSITLNGVTTQTYTMTNGYIMVFDSSGISSVVTSATLKIRGGYNQTAYGASDVSVIIIKTDGRMGGDLDGDGSQDEGYMADSNYNDLLGFTSGWGASDVTEYSGEVVASTAVSSGGVMSTAVYVDFSLNSDARSDLQNTDRVSLMPVEYDEIYLDNYNSSVTTAVTKRTFRANHASATTTSYRPYIDYTTEGGASGYGHKVAGVAAASISKVKSVATANIGKVKGVD